MNSADASVAASTWWVDVKGTEVRERLAAAGVPSLLLKGRAFAVLLYADGTPRPYVDCDLLVPPSLRGGAEAVLRGLGFVPCGGAIHSATWHRYEDRLAVDLHHTLPQADADPEHVWATLFERSTSIVVGGELTRVLDPAAAALLAALHLVSHGPEAVRPRQDLERAITHLDANCWRDAADLASQLDARPALGTGLRLLPAGVEIAERMCLPWAPSARTLLQWHRAPFGAFVWESLASAPDLRTRASLVLGFLMPSSAVLRERSPLARQGGCGLLLAYFLRPFGLTAKLARSLAAWRRDRRPGGQPWGR